MPSRIKHFCSHLFLPISHKMLEVCAYVCLLSLCECVLVCVCVSVSVSVYVRAHARVRVLHNITFVT